MDRLRSLKACVMLLGVTVFALSLEAQDVGHPMVIAKAGKQPRVATGINHELGIVYGAGDTIFCVSSVDGGKSYSAPAVVAKVPELTLDMRRGPQLAIAKDFWVITAINAGGNLLSWSSKDAGKTWTGPSTVSDRTGAAREGLHTLCASTQNEVYAAWLDLRDNKTKLFGSRSTDGGQSWSKNILIYESPDGTICQCCHPSLAADRKGHIYAMWRNWIKGARDMYLSTSENGGLTFGKAQKLGKGTWPLDGCPMDGGGLTVGSDGKIMSIWRREGTIYTALPDGDEKSLDQGRQPVIVAANDGFYTAWQAHELIMLAKPGHSSPIQIAKGLYPSIAAGGNEHDPVILTWQTMDPEKGVMALTLPRN